MRREWRRQDAADEENYLVDAGDVFERGFGV